MSQVSIVVPVYNAEKTLSRCLNSIQSQTFTDFEVILINDGSTDNSLKICQKYCDTDKRFKLINQKNSGPSAARNKGIDNATSKYLTFLDSDDYIESNAIEEFFAYAETNDADMTICGFYIEYDDGHITKHTSRNKPGLYVGEDCRKVAIDSINFYGGGIRPYSGIRFLKRECLENPRLRFNTNLHRSEDYLMWTKCFFKINRLCLITDKIFYHYIENKKSITHSYVENYWDMIKIFYTDLVDTLPKEKNIIENLNYVLIQRSYVAMHIAANAKTMKIFRRDFNKIAKDVILNNVIKSIPFSIGIKKFNIFYLFMRLHMRWVIRLVYTHKYFKFHQYLR